MLFIIEISGILFMVLESLAAEWLYLFMQVGIFKEYLMGLNIFCSSMKS